MQTEIKTVDQLDIVKSFVAEMRVNRGITPTRITALSQEGVGSGAQYSEMHLLLEALCSAKEGTAEWMELEGGVAQAVLNELVALIAQLALKDAFVYSATILLLWDKDIDAAAKRIAVGQ